MNKTARRRGRGGYERPSHRKKKPAIKLVCTNEHEQSPGERRHRRPREIFRCVVWKMHNSDNINVQRLFVRFPWTHLSTRRHPLQVIITISSLYSSAATENSREFAAELLWNMVSDARPLDTGAKVMSDCHRDS